MKKRQNDYPWVFWFKIKFRTKWFSYFWKARGANYLEIQFLCFYISIGRPWKESYLESTIRDYCNLNSIKKANDSFPKKWYHVHFGKYKKMKNEINWDFLMLTMLDGGDLDIADTLSLQSEEYRIKLINIINKSKIFNLQEFVFGYVCGSVYGTDIKLKNNNI